jgi:hypothetical protein
MRRHGERGGVRRPRAGVNVTSAPGRRRGSARRPLRAAREELADGGRLGRPVGQPAGTPRVGAESAARRRRRTPRWRAERRRASATVRALKGRLRRSARRPPRLRRGAAERPRPRRGEDTAPPRRQEQGRFCSPARKPRAMRGLPRRHVRRSPEGEGGSPRGRRRAPPRTGAAERWLNPPHPESLAGNGTSLFKDLSEACPSSWPGLVFSPGT